MESKVKAVQVQFIMGLGQTLKDIRQNAENNAMS